jgi:hypothetical protein
MQSSRSPKDTSVKFFTSEMVGAPGLTQAAGTLIGVLSACLVNGFGMQQVSSFVVTQGLGQITVPVATGWERMCVIDVAGCTDVSYNGEYKLTQVSTDGLRVSFPIDAPDGTVQGAAITVKLAPAGWLLRFADPATNKAVYMPGTPQWVGHCLRVEDPVGTHADVRGYESMSGLDDGLGMFPTTAQISRSTWPKAFATTRAARWLVAADDRLAYVGAAAGYAGSTTSVAYLMRWFGRFEPLSLQDMHSITVSVQNGASNSGSAPAQSCAGASSTSGDGAGVVVARTRDGLSASPWAFTSLMYPYNTDSGSDNSCGAANGVQVEALVFAQKFLRHSAGGYPRARMPAILHAMHTSLGAIVSEGALLSLQGRLHRLFSGPNSSSGGLGGGLFCAIDVEGPWL